MKRKIIGIFVCTLLIAIVIPTIGTSALVKNISTQPTIELENSHFYFNLNSKNWSYKKSDIQIQTTHNNSNPCIGVLSSYKSPLHQLRNAESDNITTFQEESTNQVIVIKLSSAHEMKIKNFTAKFNLSIINKQKTDFSFTCGTYLVNASGKLCDFMSLTYVALQNKRTLQYFKLGSFIYDNRRTFDYGGWAWESSLWLSNYSLPAGDWFFIFYAGFYDVPNNNTLIQTKVSINIIDKSDDLKGIKNEQGTFYGLWYGELNPVFSLSKAWVFDVMFRGTTQFFVNNTFLFSFNGGPVSDGNWSIYWETPTGIKKCKLDVYEGVSTSSSSEEEANWCTFGNGGSGSYRLTTHYIDRAGGVWSTCPLHLSAIDVPLN
jgi:hypothetical protein